MKYSNIGSLIGLVIGFLVAYFMAINTKEIIEAPETAILATIVISSIGCLGGGVLGNISTHDEIWCNEDGSHLPSLGDAIASGIFSGAMGGACGWVFSILFIYPLITKIF